MPNFKNGIFASCLCDCKFKNEFNENNLEFMYHIINKKIKQLNHKPNDKAYLMMMEEFYKKNYERCNCCNGRFISDKLISLSRPLQNNFKNVKFNKFRKSTRHNNNMIINFLYNICYDGVKHLHYPIYLINGLIELFADTTFHGNINYFNYITDDNKIAKTTYYALNLIGIEFLSYDIPLDFNTLKIIKTYSFQYPNDRPKKIINYKISKLVCYNSNYLYNAFYNNNNCYLYRIRVEKIYILSNDILPFKDVCCLLFYHDKFIKRLYDNNNILLELKIQAVNVYDNGNKYVKPFNYTKYKKKQHKHLLLDQTVNNLLNKMYILNDDGINIFDKSLLTDIELNELFNPKTETNDDADINNKVKDIIDNNNDSNDDSNDDNDDNDDNDSNDSNDSNDDNNDNNDDDDSIEEQKYLFSYNKHFEFTDYDKMIIERSIYNKLLDNEKMKILFKPYTTINVIKNINKTYTKQRYFNVILFNTDNKTLSNQYHIYLNDDNIITSITEINDLLD